MSIDNIDSEVYSTDRVLFHRICIASYNHNTILKGY